ncbi:hypothetical protein ACOMHN_002315 [Nucella lapillus]
MASHAVLTIVCALVSIWSGVRSNVVTMGISQQCLSGAVECISGNRGEGQFPLCSDCAVFVKCAGASSALMTCPSGTLYDASLGVCNFPSSVVCRTTTGTTSTSTTGTTATPADASATGTASLLVFQECVSGVEQCANLTSGQYASCSDCATFVKCNGAQGSGLIPCANGLHYDVNLGVCGPPETSACGVSAISQSLALFRQCLSGVEQCVNDNLATGQYPSCSECTSFVKCDGGGSGVISCNGGLLYDVNLGVCTFPASAECGATNAK